MEEQQCPVQSIDRQTIESSEATPIASESSSWRRKRARKARMEAMRSKRWASEPSTASPNLPGQASVVSPSSIGESSATPPNLLESSSAASPNLLEEPSSMPIQPHSTHATTQAQYSDTSAGDIDDHLFPPPPPEDESSCSEVKGYTFMITYN